MNSSGMSAVAPVQLLQCMNHEGNAIWRGNTKSQFCTVVSGFQLRNVSKYDRRPEQPERISAQALKRALLLMPTVSNVKTLRQTKNIQAPNF